MRSTERAKLIKERTVRIANFIIENHATSREAGREFKLSWSIVCRDMHNRLQQIDSQLYKKVLEVFDKNTEINQANIVLAAQMKGWRKRNASSNT